MFVNLTNHPVSNWSEFQVRKAEEWGEIVEIPFPDVSASSSKHEVLKMAAEIVEKVKEILKDSCDPTSALLCQGEFTLVYAVVRLMKKYTSENSQDIKILAACSERDSRDILNPDGTVKKVIKFDFVGFREYPDC